MKKTALAILTFLALNNILYSQTSLIKKQTNKATIIITNNVDSVTLANLIVQCKQDLNIVLDIKKVTYKKLHKTIHTIEGSVIAANNTKSEFATKQLKKITINLNKINNSYSFGSIIVR